MVALTVQLENADRMMVAASVVARGVAVTFADGRRGIVPLTELPEVPAARDIASIELPNAYEIVLRTASGDVAEIPWDFARAYCDERYRDRVAAVAAGGQRAIGARVRELRAAASMTQEELARAAGIGRVTLVRIERDEQSPRYDTLIALAKAVGREPRDLMAPVE